MAEITLINGNKNYGYWPLPAWLCLKAAKLEFEEITIPFGEPDSRERFERMTPMGSVPTLIHGDLTIWDSLAICEYVAELAPEGSLWPDDRSTHAMARSVVADMHSFSGSHVSGARSLGDLMPTNIRRRTGPIELPADL